MEAEGPRAAPELLVGVVPELVPPLLLMAALTGLVGALLMTLAVELLTGPEPVVVAGGGLDGVPLGLFPVLGLRGEEAPVPEGLLEVVLGVDPVPGVPVRPVPVASVGVDPLLPVVVPVEPTVPLVPAVLDPVAVLGVTEPVPMVLPVPGLLPPVPGLLPPVPGLLPPVPRLEPGLETTKGLLGAVAAVAAGLYGAAAMMKWARLSASKAVMSE